MPYKEPKESGDLIRLVRSIDWPHRLNNQQVIVYPPGTKKPISIATRTGDSRGFENAKAKLRRAGLFTALAAKDAGAADAARAAVERERSDAEALIQQINDQAADAAEGGVTVARRDELLYDLAKRCENVGWPVRTVGTDKSHLIVTPPGKRPITIATGSSVRNYPAAVLAKLTRAGLLDAEDKMSLQNEESRQQRLRQDRAKVTTSHAVDPPESTVDPDKQDDPDKPKAHPSPAITDPHTGDAPGGVRDVDGIAVAEWGWAKTPVGALDKKATELLLEDGSIRYACHLGDFIGYSWQAVSKHRKAKHPQLLGNAAKKRAADAAAALAAEPTMEPAVDKPPAEVAAERNRPVVVALPKPPPAVFKPATNGADTPANRQQLARLLGSSEAAQKADAAPTSVRRVSAAPPAVRVGISAVAAATPPAQSNGHSAAPAAPTSPPPADLGAMVAKLRKLAGVEAERAQLITERDRLELENTTLRKEIDRVKHQAASLADQCISSNREIHRLREKLEADAAIVEQAKELQKLMSSLMGGIPAQPAA